MPLTLNHVLFGQLGGEFEFVPESEDETTFNPKKTLHRWIREWRPALNVGRTWLIVEQDLQVWDVVLVISPNKPPFWSLAIQLFATLIQV